MQRAPPPENNGDGLAARLGAEGFGDLPLQGAPNGGDPLPERLEDARARWPGVRVDGPTFARYLKERMGSSAPTRELLPQLCVSDLFLAFACSRGDAVALSLMESRYMAQLPRALARVDGSPAFADEVLQLLRRKLFSPEHGGPPRIVGYAGRGSLMGWLRAAALRTALSLRGAHWREQRLDSAIEADLIAGAADPEADLANGELRSHLRSALSHAFGSLSAEERNLMRLHLVEGLSIDRLATMFQIHRSTVARRVNRIREMLLQETRGYLVDRAGLCGGALDSALRLLQSGMDLSLSFLAD